MEFTWIHFVHCTEIYVESCISISFTKLFITKFRKIHNLSFIFSGLRNIRKIRKIKNITFKICIKMKSQIHCIRGTYHTVSPFVAWKWHKVFVVSIFSCIHLNVFCKWVPRNILLSSTFAIITLICHSGISCHLIKTKIDKNAGFHFKHISLQTIAMKGMFLHAPKGTV
jgi:hypothetical protein